ncbi:MAG: methyltransferase domain-containing protein [bacterium]|nr:methyltransferase domain-containing protein [bacterium]
MMVTLDSRKYFYRYIQIAPLSLALWRGVEAAAFAEHPLNHPILDVGCGFGEFGGVFFDSTVEVGIDLNQKDLLHAAKSGKYKQTAWADARKLPFKSKQFRTVISVSTIEHITDRHDQVFREIYRVLKPGGRLICTMPTTHLYSALSIPTLLEFIGWKDAAHAYFRLYNKAFKHVFLPPPNVWKRLVRNAGFDIEVFEGTLSRLTLFFFEAFLPIAFISQIEKLFFGKRAAAFPSLRRRVLGPFSVFMQRDPKNLANIIIVARKPK